MTKKLSIIKALGNKFVLVIVHDRLQCFSQTNSTQETMFFMMFNEPVVRVSPKLHQYLVENWPTLEKQTDINGNNFLQAKGLDNESKIKLLNKKKTVTASQYLTMLAKEQLTMNP